MNHMTTLKTTAKIIKHAMTMTTITPVLISESSDVSSAGIFAQKHTQLYTTREKETAIEVLQSV